MRTLPRAQRGSSTSIDTYIHRRMPSYRKKKRQLSSHMSDNSIVSRVIHQCYAIRILVTTNYLVPSIPLRWKTTPCCKKHCLVLHTRISRHSPDKETNYSLTTHSKGFFPHATQHHHVRHLHTQQELTRWSHYTNLVNVLPFAHLE